jgi:hypothetical protein
MSDRLGYILGLIALVCAFLPHWLDPLILLKEKREGWEQRPERPRSGLAIVIALAAAVGGVGSLLPARSRPSPPPPPPPPPPGCGSA